jgi:hypothetical protein
MPGHEAIEEVAGELHWRFCKAAIEAAFFIDGGREVGYNAYVQ